jgi:hypothetical protein
MPTDINYASAPTDEDMMRTLLPEPEEMYGYREAFMNDSEAPNREGNAVEYPSLGENSDGEDGFEGELIEIKDEDPHPLIKLEYDGLVAAWTEYGWKYHITFNDIQDQVINLTLVHSQADTKKRMRGLDAKAGAVLDANKNATTIGNDSEAMDYEAIVDAVTYMEDETGYDPDLIIASPQAYAEWLKSDHFTGDTEQFAGELRGGGTPDDVLLDLPVTKVRRGPLQGTNSAYVIDTGMYGWESPRRQFSVDRERNNDNRRFEYYVDGRYDWVPTEPGALVEVIGGASGA